MCTTEAHESKTYNNVHMYATYSTEKNGFLKNGNQENVVDCDI